MRWLGTVALQVSSPWPWDIVESEPLWSLFALATVFVVAVALGVLGSSVYHRKAELSMRESVAAVIVVVWVMSTTAQIIVPGYQVSIYINGLMGGVAGWLFGMNKRIRIIINGEANE